MNFHFLQQILSHQLTIFMLLFCTIFAITLQPREARARVSTLDTSFNGSGMLIGDITTASEDLSVMVVQPDGKLDAAGTCMYTGSTIGANNGLYLCASRYDLDGSLDTSFGTYGVWTGRESTLNPLTFVQTRYDSTVSNIMRLADSQRKDTEIASLCQSHDSLPRKVEAVEEKFSANRSSHRSVRSKLLGVI